MDIHRFRRGIMASFQDMRGSYLRVCLRSIWEGEETSRIKRSLDEGDGLRSKGAELEGSLHTLDG